MGDETLYQPLTRQDRVTVVIYRTGIVITTILINLCAYFTGWPERLPAAISSETAVNVFIIAIYCSTALSVFFIHLYVSKFHRGLKKLFYIALAALALMAYLGDGSPAVALRDNSITFLLLLPLSGCLGFITAKEAFCFRLAEGYLLAFLMPFFLLALSVQKAEHDAVSFGLFVMAALMVFFTLRKAFMPLHYDIGDKSAYQ